MNELTDDLKANSQRFLDHLREAGAIWGLQSESGWVVVDSTEFEDSEVMPFWSEEAFAKVHCVGEWENFEPVPIDPLEFVEEWLPGMHADGALVGLNWNAELEGLEFEPGAIAELIAKDAQVDET